MLERAEGVWLWDADGNRYIDGTASLWYSNIGHGRQRMADAIAEQIVKLDAYSIFGDITNGPADALARRLADLAPMDDARVLADNGWRATASRPPRSWRASTGPRRASRTARM